MSLCTWINDLRGNGDESDIDGGTTPAGSPAFSATSRQRSRRHRPVQSAGGTWLRWRPQAVASRHSPRCAARGPVAALPGEGQARVAYFLLRRVQENVGFSAFVSVGSMLD